MLTITQAFVVLIIFLLIVEFFKLQKARKQFPPGPAPLPLLGNLVHLKFQFHRDLLMELAKTHGNIYTLWFGWAPVIILNGYQAVKDGMTTHPEDVSGRMVSPFFRAMAKGKGIILASGRSWKQQRRFGIMTLRCLGMGKKGLEYRVQEEASHLVDVFVNLKGIYLLRNQMLFSPGSVSSVCKLTYPFLGSGWVQSGVSKFTKA
uniref:Uncharacterized protein n=1 Tax=Falco tinnunculus TaxID=100819 RepID=A0A8C4VAR7_FALTI